MARVNLLLQVRLDVCYVQSRPCAEKFTHEPKATDGLLLCFRTSLTFPEFAVVDPPDHPILISRFHCRCFDCRCSCHEPVIPGSEDGMGECEDGCYCAEFTCTCGGAIDLQPALSKVSSRIRKVSLGFYYEQNVFKAVETWEHWGYFTFQDWLWKMGRENRRKLRNVYLETSYEYLKERVLKWAPPWIKLGEYEEGNGYRIQIMPTECENDICGENRVEVCRCHQSGYVEGVREMERKNREERKERKALAELEKEQEALSQRIVHRFLRKWQADQRRLAAIC